MEAWSTEVVNRVNERPSDLGSKENRRYCARNYIGFFALFNYLSSFQLRAAIKLYETLVYNRAVNLHAGVYVYIIIIVRTYMCIKCNVLHGLFANYTNGVIAYRGIITDLSEQCERKTPFV